jgi:hypothetical protein
MNSKLPNQPKSQNLSHKISSPYNLYTITLSTGMTRVLKGTTTPVAAIWQYGLLSFQTMDTKSEKKLPKN